MLTIIAILIPIFATAAIVYKKWPLSKDGMIQCAIYFGGTLLVASIICAGAYWGGISKSNFNEIGNFKIISMTHEEKWTTKERHEETTGEGKNKKTRVWYTTESHGPYWTAADEYGNTYNFSEADYRKWKLIWGTEARIGTHNGSAAGWDRAITGGIYEIRWNYKFESIFPYEKIWSYQNKVRVTNSVFKYAEASEKLLATYPRPADKNNAMPVVSYDGTMVRDDEMMVLRQTNALLGRSSQIHCMVVLFNADKTAQNVVGDVLTAWQGTNMNELVVFVGLKGREIVWAEAASWEDNTSIHGLLVQRLFEMKNFDGHAMSVVLKDLVPKHWHRKNFKKDFDYLTVDIHYGWIIMALLLTIGECVGAYLFMVYKVDNHSNVRNFYR